MKKGLIAIIAMVGLAGSAFAQGTVLFSNNSGSLVTYGEGPDAGTSVPVGSFSVALYWAVSGTTDPGAFVQIGNSANIAPIAGRYSGGTRTTGDATAPSADAAFLVRAWSSADGATWEEASQVPGAWEGSSTIFESATGGGGSGPLPDPAVSLAGSVPAFTVGLVPIPEPSVILLGLAGAGVLWFRRKK